MNQLTTSTAVGEFVAEMPGRARLFAEHGIDFCCGGKRPLRDACQEKGLNPDAMLAQLVGYRPLNSDRPSIKEKSLTSICDQIEATHHAYLRRELPRMAQMSEKVVNAHGVNHPEMVKVAGIFAAMRAEMASHMMKEEQVLFPAIRQLETGDGGACSHCGSVGNPIRVMENEHESAGAALTEMRRLTGDYTPPADACNTFRALLAALEELEADMHEHVAAENNVLFPRAIELEKQLQSR
jgi:regulator of cell morphogenesis and NO signaling